METLEPNMYVRTKKSIGKVYQICKNEKNEDGTIYNKFILNTNDRLEICDTDLVVKASHNIIDLIEVGDYVNGVEIENFKIIDGEIYAHSFDDEILVIFNKDNVKSIVTKQQFEAIKYEIN